LIVVWTKHAEYRLAEWQKEKGITREDVESVAGSPEQIVPGDMQAMVAQSKFGGGLIRVPFLEVDGNRKILTLYWTSKVERYWSQGLDSEKK
jgi:hypothetical protein